MPRVNERAHYSGTNSTAFAAAPTALAGAHSVRRLIARLSSFGVTLRSIGRLFATRYHFTAHPMSNDDMKRSASDPLHQTLGQSRFGSARISRGRRKL